MRALVPLTGTCRRQPFDRVELRDRARFNQPGRDTIENQEGETLQNLPNSRKPVMQHSSRRQTEITTSQGLHLRAAYRLVELAKQFRSEVSVIYNGRAANCRSILDLMTLAAELGARLEIEAQGADAEAAATAVRDLIEADFRECGDPAPAERET